MGAGDAGRYMLEEWRATTVGPGESTEETVSVPGRPAAFAGEEAVKYATSFADPREGDDRVACLHLSGLYAHAGVDVTGEPLGEGTDVEVEHDAYFEPLRIPFVPYEDNEVTVTCEAPRDRFGGLHDTDAVAAADRVPGIWWAARLESHPLPYVDTVTVRPEVTGDNARLHVRTTVVTGGPLEDRITYSLKPEGDLQTRGMMDRGQVTAGGAGKTTVEHTVDIRDPALWWPAGHGRQHRYTLTAKLGDSEHTVTTGVCEVERDGSDLVVNGERVGIRGVNLLTAAPSDVERARDLNANLVRAHAQVLPPSVYEACDEAGVLVWQDLPLTGPGGFDVGRARDLAERCSRAVGRFPSLAVFGVHDDPTATFAEGLGSGLLDSLRLRWRAWRSDYDRGPAERVAEAFVGDRPVVPVVGEPGTDPDAGAYYPGWAYGTVESTDGLLERYPVPVVAEYGAAALGTEPVEAAPGFDAARHATRVQGEGVEASQAYQREVLQGVTARLRRAGVGAVAYALRDTDGAGMGVFAADGTEKAGAAALRASLAPVGLFLADPGAAESAVVVVNDAPSEVAGEVTWTAGEATGTLEVSVPAGETWTGGAVSLPEGAETATLALTAGPAPVEQRYSL